MSDVLVQVPAGPVVGPLAVLAGAVAVIMLVRLGRLSPRRLITLVASVVYAAAVLSLTFFPMQIATGSNRNQASWYEKANLIPVLTIDVHTFVLNILLFMPLGALLVLWRRPASWRDALKCGLLVSGVIEACQWIGNIVISSGRSADVNDVLANSGGAVLGFILASSIIRVCVREQTLESWSIRPHAAHARRGSQMAHA